MEYLPSARLAWKPTADRLVWGSLSRAVRAPARFDRDVRFPATPPFAVVGGPNFESEVADVVELGYRVQHSETISYSLTGFVHFWDRLRSGSALPVELENKIEGTVQGIEAWAEYRPFEFWLLSGGVTYLQEDLRLKAGSTDPVGVDNPTLRNDPDYQWQLRSSFDLPRDFQFDLQLRRVDALPNPQVPAYTELDVRLAWLVGNGLEFAARRSKPAARTARGIRRGRRTQRDRAQRLWTDAMALLRRLAVLLVGLLLLAGDASAALSEHRLKAVFLFNFSKFVEWPPSAFAAADAPFVIGVFGRDPFGSDLDDVARGETVNGRQLAGQARADGAGRRGMPDPVHTRSRNERISTKFWQR